MKTLMVFAFALAVANAQFNSFTRPTKFFGGRIAARPVLPVLSVGGGGSDGAYRPDNSGAYRNEDGQYHPDDSGSYVHQDAKYNHLDDKYRHQADRFGGSGGGGGGGGGAGGSGGAGGAGSDGGARGVLSAGTSGGASGIKSGSGSSGIGTRTGAVVIVGSGAGSGSGAGHGASGSSFGGSVSGLVKGSASGKYDNRNYGIIRQVGKVEEDGYHYLYETENGITGEEQGKLANRDTDAEGMRATGFYTYTGPDNVIYTVNYSADENGFVPEGAHIPQPPPVPEYILRALEYQRSIGTL